MSEPQVNLLVTNIGQLVSMQGPVPRIGEQLSDIGLIEGGAIAVSGGEIVSVGPADVVERKANLTDDCQVIDADGQVVTPGLIDPHTHPVFSRTRENEFEMRVQGKAYMEIAEAGGGIRASVRDLRTAPREIIKQRSFDRLTRMLTYGTTTAEAKSGYGLSTEAELLSLELIKELNDEHVVGLIPTFLGAHEIPDEYRGRTDQYIELINEEMLPQVVEGDLAEFSDVFCEVGVFDIEQSRRIQSAAKAAGLGLKFHADEIKPLGGAELAAELGAVSADHLVKISDAGIAALADAGTAAVLLPGTTFSLGHQEYAPARRMIEEGVIISLSTDCNPGSSCTESLPMIISLAAVHMKLTAAESLSAVTVNAAYAINRGGKTGQLQAGMPADLIVWEMQDYRELPYHYGINLVQSVVKGGRIVVRDRRPVIVD